MQVQLSRARFIEQIYQLTQAPGIVYLELGELQSRLDSIDNYWTKFEDLHEKLFFARDSAILDHSYARDQVYNRCLTHYTTARAALVQAMSTLVMALSCMSR